VRQNSPADENSLRCSFCRKKQGSVGKLISSPSDYPRAYICDECVAVCASIIEDDKVDIQGSEDQGSEDQAEAPPPHPLLSHPLASNLMEAVEDWIHEESLGKNGLIALAEMRSIAKRIISGVGF
jgi:ATP-dependent protease Clp ATPase subunit